MQDYPFRLPDQHELGKIRFTERSNRGSWDISACRRDLNRASIRPRNRHTLLILDISSLLGHEKLNPGGSETQSELLPMTGTNPNCASVPSPSRLVPQLSAKNLACISRLPLRPGCLLPLTFASTPSLTLFSMSHATISRPLYASMSGIGGRMLGMAYGTGGALGRELRTAILFRANSADTT